MIAMHDQLFIDLGTGINMLAIFLMSCRLARTPGPLSSVAQL